MKTNFFNFPILIGSLLLLLLVGGCQHFSQKSIEVSPRPVSIASAKEFFEATKGRSKIAPKYQFYWDLAGIKTVGDLPVVVIPVENIGGGNTLIENQNNKTSTSRIGTEHLLIYSNAEGKLTGSLSSMSEADSLETATHKIYFFDWIDHSLQSIWTLKGGNLIQTEKAIQNSTAKLATCTLDLYKLVCDGHARVGGGNFPSGLPNPDEGCHWEYVGSTACGGGAAPTNPSPTNPSPLPVTGPIIFGGGGGSNPGGTGIYTFGTQPNSNVIGLMNAVAPYGILFSSHEIAVLNTLPLNAINRIMRFLLTYRIKATWLYENIIQASTGEAFNSQEREILLRKGESFYQIYFLAYASNAYAAMKLTEYNFNLCASTCSSCKGNAFKHAMFRIFDAETFGYATAIDLGNAHEASEDPNNPETIMDKINNNVGLDIFGVNSWLPRTTDYWVDKVMQAINQGNRMVFLQGGNQVPTYSMDWDCL
jgi:hypothetical protein